MLGCCPDLGVQRACPKGSHRAYKDIHSHIAIKAAGESHILVTNAQKQSRSVHQFYTRVRNPHFGSKPGTMLRSPWQGWSSEQRSCWGTAEERAAWTTAPVNISCALAHSEVGFSLCRDWMTAAFLSSQVLTGLCSWRTKNPSEIVHLKHADLQRPVSATALVSLLSSPILWKRTLSPATLLDPELWGGGAMCEKKGPFQVGPADSHRETLQPLASLSFCSPQPKCRCRSICSEIPNDHSFQMPKTWTEFAHVLHVHPNLLFSIRAYGIHTKELWKRWKNLPACPFFLLSSTQVQNWVLCQERCDEDGVMGEGSVTEADTWQQHPETHQSCHKQLVHNKFMICIFYAVFMRHSHMAIPAAGRAGERTRISHQGLLWQQIIRNNHCSNISPQQDTQITGDSFFLDYQ